MYIKRILLIILLNFPLANTLMAHNELLWWNGSFWVTVSDPSWATKWPSYSNLPLLIEFTEDNIPWNLTLDDVMDDFRGAYGQWQNVPNGCVSFVESIVGGISISFTDDPNVFALQGFDPFSYPGFTTHSVDFFMNEFKLPTSITLNNFDGFINVYGWRRGLPDPGKFNFTHVVLHELGHVIGLDHCTAGGNPVMYESIDPQATPRVTLTWADEDGVELLCSVVGVEDAIWINLSLTHYNVDQIYFGTNSATFIDNFPLGDYIVEWGPWQIEASYGCGEVLVFEHPTPYYINIPALPEGYLWERDASDNVIATISTSGIDNTGYNHQASRQITIGSVPNTFITAGTHSSNTIWCGDITITGNITVPSGIILTIEPYSNIIFQNNASLIVNGILEATGCELNGGTGTWGSINFDGASASQSFLSNVIVNDGVGIRCLNGADVSISNSTIDHCTEGIYIYNSEPAIINNQIIEPVQNGINGEAPGKRPLIQGNVITKTASNPQYKQFQGIIFGNSTRPFITHNDISGFYHAVYLGGGTVSYFTDNSYVTSDPNNRLRDSRSGLTTRLGRSHFSWS